VYTTYFIKINPFSINEHLYSTENLLFAYVGSSIIQQIFSHYHSKHSFKHWEP